MNKKTVTIFNKMKTKFYAIKGLVLSPGEEKQIEMFEWQINLYKNYSNLIDMKVEEKKEITKEKKTRKSKGKNKDEFKDENKEKKETDDIQELE